MTTETARAAPMTRAEMLTALRTALDEAGARDLAERERRVRSAFGLAKDAAVPPDFVAPQRLPSYTISVDAAAYRTQCLRAAAMPVLLAYLNDSDVARMIP